MKKTLMTPNGSYDYKNDRLKKYRFRRIFVIGSGGFLVFPNWFDKPSKAREFLLAMCNGNKCEVEGFDILSFEVRV